MRALPWLLLLLAACATTRPAQWEHWCVDFDPKPANPELQRAGDEGWEMVSMAFRPPVSQQGSSVGGGATLVCFKRPKVTVR
ncbi:MAG: hypothetical protein H6Q89_4261 [Myxococcaceae bacterium]|nr:hypothetical protein [Myxococcaceae bacterium]